jgi:hypothetical protein
MQVATVVGFAIYQVTYHNGSFLVELFLGKSELTFEDAPRIAITDLSIYEHSFFHGLSRIRDDLGPISMEGKNAKTYNRRDSQMVTHSSTSRPVQCLCMAERTGCPVFTDLWSYVLGCVA